MNYSKIMYKDSHWRSVTKALSWRVTATVTTIILVYLFTGELEMAVAVGGVEVVTKMILFFLHERGWDKIQFGKKAPEPYVIWFTGLSGSGKTTLSKELVKRLNARKLRVDYLDGDGVRAILPKVGFTKGDRDQHIRRVGFLASKLESNGIIVVASFVSPYEEARQFVRGLCKNFIEVYVSTPLEECERRDAKGLYKKARSGEIENFTGVSDPYEAPRSAEIVIDTSEVSLDQGVKQIQKYLDRRF